MKTIWSKDSNFSHITCIFYGTKIDSDSTILSKCSDWKKTYRDLTGFEEPDNISIIGNFTKRHCYVVIDSTTTLLNENSICEFDIITNAQITKDKGLIWEDKILQFSDLMEIKCETPPTWRVLNISL